MEMLKRTLGSVDGLMEFHWATSELREGLLNCWVLQYIENLLNPLGYNLNAT